MLLTPNSAWGIPGGTVGGLTETSKPLNSSYGTNFEKHLYLQQAFSGLKPAYLLPAWYFTASLHLLISDGCTCSG